MCKDMDQPHARDERSGKRLQKGQWPGCLDGRDYFSISNTDNARWRPGATPAADAAGHSDQVRPVAFHSDALERNLERPLPSPRAMS